MEIWSGVTIAGRQMNDEKGKLELLSHWTMEGRDEQKAKEFKCVIFLYDQEWQNRIIVYHNRWRALIAY